MSQDSKRTFVNEMGCHLDIYEREYSVVQQYCNISQYIATDHILFERGGQGTSTLAEEHIVV